MLALATYIYEWAALKEWAWTERNYTLLQKLEKIPMDLLGVANLLKDNLDRM
jgi:hypothetical protein